MCETFLLGQRRHYYYIVSRSCGAFDCKSKDLTMRAFFLMAILESLQRYANSAKSVFKAVGTPKKCHTHRSKKVHESHCAKHLTKEHRRKLKALETCFTHVFFLSSRF